LAFILYYY